MNDLRRTLEVIQEQEPVPYAVRNILESCGQERTFVYRVLNNLKEMGLVTHHKAGYQGRRWENTSLIYEISLNDLMYSYDTGIVAKRKGL